MVLELNGPQCGVLIYLQGYETQLDIKGFATLVTQSILSSEGEGRWVEKNKPWRH